ncbi:MAG: hypothetical protein RLT05_07070 [Bauldia litoralis]
MAGVTAEDRTIRERDGVLLQSFGAESGAWDFVTDAALEEGLEAAILAWFQTLLGDDAPAGSTLAEARVAWLAVDGPNLWAHRFLAADIPPALVSALREAWPRLSPREAPLAMPEQPLHGESMLSRASQRLRRAGIRRSRPAPAR